MFLRSVIAATIKSVSPHHTSHQQYKQYKHGRCFQNQNEDSVSGLDTAETVAGVTELPRMTKSASWFNSLSRRASRKTPTKKRTYALGSSNLENLAPGATRPRLNK